MRTICSIFIIFLFTTFIGLGQNRDVTENEKAVVYFFEMEDMPTAFGSYVFIYDGHEPVGTIHLKHYLRYECVPGEHLFYSVNEENKNFVEANLLAGKVYIIEVHIKPSYTPGWGMTRTTFKPVDPTQKFFDLEKYLKIADNKRSKSFHRNAEKFNKSFLESAEKNKLEKYQRRLNKYHKKKKKEKVKVLYPDWHIESEAKLLESIENETEESFEEATSQ